MFRSVFAFSFASDFGLSSCEAQPFALCEGVSPYLVPPPPSLDSLAENSQHNIVLEMLRQCVAYVSRLSQRHHLSGSVGLQDSVPLHLCAPNLCLSVLALSLQVSAVCTVLTICSYTEDPSVATVVELEGPRSLCFL